MMRTFALLFIASLSVAALTQPPRQGDRPHPPSNLRGQSREAYRIVRRIIEAERRLHMAGRRTTQLSNGERVEEKVQRLGSKMRIEYLAPKTHQGEIILDHGDIAWHYQPATKRWVTLTSPRARQLNELRERLHTGRFPVKLVGRGKVASRETDVVEFRSNEGDRLAERLNVDRRTGLVLKRERFGADGRLTGSFEYHTVDFEAVLKPEDFLPPTTLAGRVFMRMEALRAAAPFPIFEPDPLTFPEGVVFRQGRIFKKEGADVVALHYRGGKHVLTLLQMVGGSDQPPPGSGRIRGMANSYFWRQDNRSLGMVSNLPVENLKRIARSVRKR